MRKGFIATILAIALAVTGASTIQARADADDVAGALLGLAIIAGIAAAIDDDDDKGRVERRYHDSDDYRPYSHRDDYRDRHYRRHAKVLPVRCQRTFETRRGERIGFARRCLNRHAEHLELPRHCLREARTDRGWRQFYGKRCLIRDGYRVSGNGNRRSSYWN